VSVIIQDRYVSGVGQHTIIGSHLLQPWIWAFSRRTTVSPVSGSGSVHVDRETAIVCGNVVPR